MLTQGDEFRAGPFIGFGCVSLIQLYRQSNEAQVGRAEAVLAHSCDLIRDRYRFYTTGWHGPAPRLVTRISAET
jgi:hypothetical protein